MNIWIGVGRTTKIPEYKEGEHPFVKFTLAIDNPGRDKGASFIPCTAFGKTAESIYKWVKKGTKIAVDGRLQTDSYTDREGNKRSTWGIIVNSWEFAQGKEETEDEGFMNADDDGVPPWE